MDSTQPAWYCLRSLQKQEHIAAANLRQLEGVEVFSPQLRVQRSTRKGLRWFHEPLFPSYVFARFPLASMLNSVRHTWGVKYVVNFGNGWPTVPAEEIEELRRGLEVGECYESPPEFAPGDSVEILSGPFLGLTAVVQRYLPAAQRLSILLDFLGRSTMVEMQASMVSSSRHYPEELLAACG